MKSRPPPLGDEKAAARKRLVPPPRHSPSPRLRDLPDSPIMQPERILITGASSGIGAELARQWARRGRSLILAARRMDRLESLADACRSSGVECDALPCDLRDPEAPAQLHRRCRDRGWVIGGLVNNAGLGWQEPFATQAEEKIETMLAVNLLALTRLCRLFLPDMVARRSGFILNLASTAAMQPVPYFAVYAATKAYVVSLSEALHEEAKEHGVLVTAVCPGPVHTEFKKVAGMSERFFTVAQAVEPCASASIHAVDRRRAIAWTDPAQRIFSFFSGITPRPIRRKLAAALMRMSMARKA